MNLYTVTVPKYKSKSRNIMRMLIKMDECFKYYDPVVVIKNNDCPFSEITEYLSTFHNIEDYKIIDTILSTSISKKSSQPSMMINLLFGDVDTELPFIEKNEVEEESKFEITEDGCKVPKEIPKSNDKTRSVMCKINEELYSRDTWKELDTKGCCVVCVGNLSKEEEVDLEYVKNNISHSSVRHNCVNVDIKRTKDKVAVVVALTWKR